MASLGRISIALVAGAFASPALAAGLPGADDGLAGGFYLRGSLGANLMTARSADFGGGSTAITESGYGFSLGAGLGYENGDGLRADITFDHVSSDNLRDAGGYAVSLRSGVALANVYYDFALENAGLSAAGGWQAYLGAGLGAANNYVSFSGPGPAPEGHSVSFAGAAMAGIAYDMGDFVADFGYRGLYINTLSNANSNEFRVNDALLHEVRASLRYRFN